VERRGVGSGIVNTHPGDDVVDVCLGVVDDDVPIAIVVEDACIEQFELGLVLATTAVLIEQLGVGTLGLWVEVAPAHPGMRRRRVLVEPVLFGVFAVISLGPGQTKNPLLQDWVLAVPKREGQTQRLLVIANAGEPVVVPSIRARPSVIVMLLQELSAGNVRAFWWVAGGIGHQCRRETLIRQG
jgi:hypothetical protein